MCQYLRQTIDIHGDSQKLMIIYEFYDVEEAWYFTEIRVS